MQQKNKINIAIDGHSSCGKSTMARALAQRLDYIFIDTGAMYRAIAYYFHSHDIDISNVDDVNKALKNIKLSFDKDEDGVLKIHLNGKCVENEIRTMEISSIVSPIAAIKEVRRFGVAQQQEIGRNGGVVMDGRDIGTVVFPDAALKLFVTADENIRAYRRWLELKNKGIAITQEEVKANLLERDHIDSNREEGPLLKAKDAIELDTSHLTPEQQLEFAYNKAIDIIKETNNN